MANAFRTEKLEEVKELLRYWQQIEKWLKKADHYHGKALIPAINELRYAGRQLFYAIQMLDISDEHTEIEKKHIGKRIVIAEQYLQNADHDIVDSIVGTLIKETALLNTQFGKAEVTTYFPGYPKLCLDLETTKTLIQDTRHDILKRREAYQSIRADHMERFIVVGKELEAAAVEATVRAKKLQFALEQRETELKENELKLETRAC